MITEPRHNTFRLRPGGSLRGAVSVPADKSISHRAVMLGAIAQGRSEIRNWLAAGDTEATLGAMQDLGANIQRHDASSLAIDGGPLRPSDRALDLKNAGTGIRLLAGLMAGQPFPSILDGSDQLRRRPMKRITEPLSMMGADISSSDGACPLRIGPAPLQGIDYLMPVASGQVKSALLLAGLFAGSPTTVRQPGPARDHTERMLRSMGVELSFEDESGQSVTVHPSQRLQPLRLTVPGDFSSAAFLIVAALILPGAELTIRGVNLNPTRTGLLDELLLMRGEITVDRLSEQAGEPVGDIHVRASALQGIEISGQTVVRMIDEFPILMVAATQAQGETIVRDAGELRVKETDRIAVMAEELRKLGAVIDERPDGFRVLGPQQLTGGQAESHDDHRIAMSLTVAGMLCAEGAVIKDAGCAGDSFPGFAETLMGCGARLMLE